MKSEHGFTLIELLLIIAIISVLAALSIQSFTVLRGKAGYADAIDTLKNSQIALEAGITTNPNSLPAAVPLVAQSVQGQIQDARARSLLPGMLLPKNVKFQVSYDPTCADASCQSDFIRVDHCRSPDFVAWTRFGDGAVVLLENVPGSNCQ